MPRKPYQWKPIVQFKLEIEPGVTARDAVIERYPDFGFKVDTGIESAVKKIIKSSALGGGEGDVFRRKALESQAVHLEEPVFRKILTNYNAVLERLKSDEFGIKILDEHYANAVLRMTGTSTMENFDIDPEHFKNGRIGQSLKFSGDVVDSVVKRWVDEVKGKIKMFKEDVGGGTIAGGF